MAVPSEIELRSRDPPMAARGLPAWQAGLATEPRSLRRHLRRWRRCTRPTGSVVRAINLGGVHHRPGRRQRLPPYLTDDELDCSGNWRPAAPGNHRPGPADRARGASPEPRVTATPLELLALVVWGTLVGLDLVSVAQSMIARPFVAGGVAGFLLGDPMAGLPRRVLLELPWTFCRSARPAIRLRARHRSGHGAARRGRTLGDEPRPRGHGRAARFRCSGAGASNSSGGSRWPSKTAHGGARRRGKRCDSSAAMQSDVGTQLKRAPSTAMRVPRGPGPRGDGSRGPGHPRLRSR